MSSQWSSQTRPYHPAVHTSTPPILSDSSPPLNRTSLSAHSMFVVLSKMHMVYNIHKQITINYGTDDSNTWITTDNTAILRALADIIFCANAIHSS